MPCSYHAMLVAVYCKGHNGFRPFLSAQGVFAEQLLYNLHVCVYVGVLKQSCMQNLSNGSSATGKASVCALGLDWLWSVESGICKCEQGPIAF